MSYSHQGLSFEVGVIYGIEDLKIFGFEYKGGSDLETYRVYYLENNSENREKVAEIIDKYYDKMAIPKRERIVSRKTDTDYSLSLLSEKLEKKADKVFQEHNDLSIYCDLNILMLGLYILRELDLYDFCAVKTDYPF